MVKYQHYFRLNYCNLFMIGKLHIILKIVFNKSWRGCGERGTLLHSWWKCRLVQPIVESSMEIPQKIKNGSAFWPSDPTSGNISEGAQNTNMKEHKHYVHCSVIYNHQDMEAVPVSISRWVDKTTMGCLHNGILLGCKKEENFTLCDSMDGPGEHYAEWSKPVR